MLQDYLPQPNELPYRNRTERMEIGDCGELYCERNMYCLTCEKKEWNNLNNTKRNIIGVDLQCRNCNEYLQVKTVQEQPNGTCVIKQTSKNSLWWDDVIIPSFTKTLRRTLNAYHNNIRYCYIVYKQLSRLRRKIQYIAITEPLTSKNICRGAKAIRARKMKWVYRK